MSVATTLKSEAIKKNAKQAFEELPKHQDALIQQYMPFATSMANKVARTMSSEVEYEDILCSARLGLLEAARRYDDKFNVDFRTFAYYRIKGAIFDGLRKNGWVPRSMYSKMKFEQATNELLQNKANNLIENASKVGGELDQVYDTIQSIASIYVMSLDSMEDFEVEDKTARKNMEFKVEFQKIKEKMRDAIESLPDKERKLVKMYYFQNKTLQEIADTLSLSKSWASRMHAKALEMMLEKMKLMGQPIGGESAENNLREDVHNSLAALNNDVSL